MFDEVDAYASSLRDAAEVFGNVYRNFPYRLTEYGLRDLLIAQDIIGQAIAITTLAGPSNHVHNLSGADMAARTHDAAKDKPEEPR